MIRILRIMFWIGIAIPMIIWGAFDGAKEYFQEWLSIGAVFYGKGD